MIVPLFRGPSSCHLANDPVTLQNAETTITVDQEHLNQIGSGLELANQLKTMVRKFATPSATLEVKLDLKSIERISSAGVNELIGIHTEARSRGVRLVLLNVSESVREVFSLTRLERIFEFGCTQAGC